MSTNFSVGGVNYQADSSQYVRSVEDAVVSRPIATVPIKVSGSLNENEMKSSFDLRRAEQLGDVLPISDEQVMKAIERAIKAAEGITTSLQFSVHKETHQISVKVLDKETGEIIREIPPEKNLDFLATLWRKAGILIDEKR
jgi:flagellar protein FlaG